MYAVFVQHVATDEGKTLVRQHISDFDAQTIYKELVEYHLNSMHAEMTGDSILQFLTSFKLGITPWKGKTTVSFVTYFLEQLRLYNELQLSAGSTAMNNQFKVTVFDQAVQGIEDLRQVQITFNTLCLQLKQKATFQEYFSLLHEASTVYDAHQQSRSRSHAHDSRRVYATRINEASEFTVNDDFITTQDKSR